jgi:hypothetical protein
LFLRPALQNHNPSMNLISRTFNRLGNAFHDTLENLPRRRYLRSLEEEVARLRAENRALLNSLLGTAGIAPLETPGPAGPSHAPIRRRSWPQLAAQFSLQAESSFQANASSHGHPSAGKQ